MRNYLLSYRFDIREGNRLFCPTQAEVSAWWNVSGWFSSSCCVCPRWAAGPPAHRSVAAACGSHVRLFFNSRFSPAAPRGESCRNVIAGTMWWLSIKHRGRFQLLATSVNINYVTFVWISLLKGRQEWKWCDFSFQTQADVKCFGSATRPRIFILLP